MREESIKMDDKIAIIRIKGENRIPDRVEYALQTLKLCKRNYCSVVPSSQSYAGMLKKTKDYVTWGEIDDETYDMLVSKRGRDHGVQKSIKYFRLNSPKKGYGRKGIKHPFKNGGAVGYRGTKINDLIKRMV